MTRVLLAAQLLVVVTVCAAFDKEEVLIGWRGETYESNQEQKQGIHAAGGAAGDAQEPTEGSSSSKGGKHGDKPWIETISWSPRAFVYHNFLSEKECDHLVNIGNKRVARSMVVDSKTGENKQDDIRTSYGAAFGRGEDAVIAEIEQRIAEWTHLPPENGEPIQILRYMDGQKYDAHWDWFDDPVHHQAYLKDGNRYATVLLYLAEVEGGGETNLPLAEAIDEEAQKLVDPSECAARYGISVRPRKGDALLFFDMNVEGNKGERAALHASCPTLKGTKWTATKWIHNKRYMGKFDPLSTATVCKDASATCKALAKEGKCESDAANMVGPTGLCRKTCGDCVVCAAGDILCMRRNLRSAYQGGADHQGSEAGGGAEPGAGAGQGHGPGRGHVEYLETESLRSQGAHAKHKA